MYVRTVHAATHASELQQLVHDYPLGILTTVVQGDSLSSTSEFPMVQHTHLPWLLDVDASGSAKSLLRGHMARSNPQAKQLVQLHRQQIQSGPSADDDHAATLPSTHVTVLFTHAAEAYISPRFYVEAKPKTGKVVPTWDYAAVEVRGTLRIVESDDFLHTQIRDLTRANEPKSLVPSQKCAPEEQQSRRHAGWNVDDAPSSYVDALARAIVGVEVRIESMTGTFKMSQEKAPLDRQGVIDGFEAYGSDDGRRMADLIGQRVELSGAAKARE